MKLSRINDKETYINRLRKIRELNMKNENFITEDLYRFICKDACLIEAFEQIKNNKGALTRGIEEESLEGFERRRLDKLKQQLSDESWQPKPARRKYISKPGKKEKRALSIQGPVEKIVQAAVYRLLEAVYEPRFLENSYGFRPNRGCHDALHDISRKYDGISFIIEGDIKGMYDNINHRTLIKLLERRIKDGRFINLIWKLLKAGYMDVDKTIVITELGTPQASIVSPILANIYLHEMDVFMRNLCTVRNPIRSKLMTPVALQCKTKIKSTERKIAKLPKSDERDALVRELKALRMQALKVRTYKDPATRIYYHRYADDFIIGVAGPKSLAEEVKEKCGKFLQSELNLTLHQQKTRITNPKKHPALFLGHEIIIDVATKKTYLYAEGKTSFLKCTTGSFVKLKAPMERAVNRMHLKGFCDGLGHPTPKRNWTSQEDNQIINLFNTTIRGWFNFYKGAHYQHRLGRMWYILRYSCAMTLASKHKSSISKIFKKHGELLKVQYGSDKNLKSIELYKPDMKEDSRKFQVGRRIKDPYAFIA
uniref:putative reverse transcriptase and intron maturase n=1 Tax=Watanabea sichuanensis TaxID=2704660 RepID=UPI002410E8A0|nr:putative reverse transcriptase and intron maturase [Watanabea sichuanensis]WDY13124.1 putative reverse transcriptase and intron maturase [Watanabea sichuanensis]